MLLRFHSGLRRFLRTPLTFEDAEKALGKYREDREHAFLDMLRHSVFPYPRSPWRQLFRSSQITFGDVEESIRNTGLSSTLSALYDAGVYCTIAEMKGKQPLVRNGLEIQCTSDDFNNPSYAGSFEITSSGSTGTPKRLLIDFALLDHDVNAQRVFLRSFGLERHQTSVWRPVPPGGAGLKRVLYQQRCGTPAQHWFTQTNPKLGSIPFKSWLFLNTAVSSARAMGAPFPKPEYVPLSEARAVAEWIDSVKQEGGRAHLDTIVSSAIRVCQAAKECGINISGTFFRVGSESLTDARAAAISSSGAELACHYSMSETGPVGMACADGHSVDDVHLLEGKLAVLQRSTSAIEEAIFLTTLLPGAPRIMINAESGDSAIVEARTCGCVFGSAGYTTHLRTIRSYEKVSAEGMYYLGVDLIRIAEQVLPQMFGGVPTDYQFVHEQAGGLNRIVLLIAPTLGALDEETVRRCVLERLASHSRGDWMKAQIWRDGDVLKLVRDFPVSTAGMKFSAVRFVRGS